jgi:hypothetical protein
MSGKFASGHIQKGLGKDLSLFFTIARKPSMKSKKNVLLFLALIFPACIFVFLKFFGKNEFNVPALYSETYPEGVGECGTSISLPYRLPDSVRASLDLSRDSLTLIYFGLASVASENQIKRIRHEYGQEIAMRFMDDSSKQSTLKTCVFFLQEAYDLALIDGAGAIRGQYISDDREEIDRLLTEAAILLKKY